MSQKKNDATESVHEIIGCEQSLIFLCKVNALETQAREPR